MNFSDLRCRVLMFDVFLNPDLVFKLLYLLLEHNISLLLNLNFRLDLEFLRD